jgi:SAM-dependent methyltransferase
MVSHEKEVDQSPQILIPPEWLNQTSLLIEKFCREIRNVDPRMAIKDLADSCGAEYQLIKTSIEKYEQPRVLEIGAGFGFGICYLRKLGFNVLGVEPGNSAGFEGRYAQAIQLLEANGISDGSEIIYAAAGESLPFANMSFDIVYSVAVLEHVNDVKQCLLEALRVVRPGGLVIMSVPSYNSFIEGHYNILWLPHLLKAKRVAKWYVRVLWGRQDWFIDELNFTTPRYFKALANTTAQLEGMELYLHVDRSVPILGRVFGWLADAYYFLKDRSPAPEIRLKHRILLRCSGWALKVGEFFGMVPSCNLVWRLPSASVLPDRAPTG